MADDWKGWKNGKYDNRYKGVKRHSGKSSTKRIIIVSVVVICALIGGYFVFQTYGTPQIIQNQPINIINNTVNKIQQIYSQNKVTSLTNDNRVPIAVYDNCKSFIRTDLKTIDTTCNLANLGEKQFKFNIPDVLEQALQGSALGFVNTKVYQYGSNDFKIGLYDQVGEKNYTVTLWQLP